MLIQLLGTPKNWQEMAPHFSSLSKSSDKAAKYSHIIAFSWFLNLEKGLGLSAQCNAEQNIPLLVLKAESSLLKQNNIQGGTTTV